MTTLMTPDQTHPAPPPGLIPFPLTMQLKMKRYYGHLFLAAGRMYFVCDKQEAPGPPRSARASAGRSAGRSSPSGPPARPVTFPRSSTS